MTQMLKNLRAMQETWVQSLGQEDTLEEEVATHSSVLAWRITWTEEPGGLQSMGSHRLAHWKVTLTLPEAPSLPAATVGVGALLSLRRAGPSPMPPVTVGQVRGAPFPSPLGQRSYWPPSPSPAFLSFHSFGSLAPPSGGSYCCLSYWPESRD